jgi:hypothetical protein
VPRGQRDGSLRPYSQFSRQDNLKPSLNIIRITKTMKMTGDGHVERMEENKNAF